MLHEMSNSGKRGDKTTRKMGEPRQTQDGGHESADSEDMDDLLAAYVGTGVNATRELPRSMALSSSPSSVAVGWERCTKPFNSPRREVALKVLKPKYDFYDRLEQEATLSAQLSHPSIARVWGLGDQTNGPFINSELVRGFTWAELTQIYKHPSRAKPGGLVGFGL